MKRKVVQIAGFTKVVSLPSEWVKKNKVKKGDEVEVSEHSDSLVISLDNKSKEIKRAFVDASKLDKHIVWPILALLHKTGYDEIKISSADKDILKVIYDKVASSLFGFEVIEHTPDYCLVKNIAEGSSSNLNNVLRKIFLVTISQANQSLEFFKSKEIDSINEVLKLEETNNKLTNFCQRLLNAETLSLENRYNYFIVWLLENIGDGYRDLCKSLLDHKGSSVSPPVLKVYSDVNKLIEKYYNLFYKFDLENFAGFIKSLNRAKSAVVNLLSKNKGLDVLVLSHLLYIINVLYDFIGASIFLKANLDVTLKEAKK